MKRNIIELFTSEPYRLLCLLDSLQVNTSDGKRIRENQDEIAQLFHASKGKLNPLMQLLENAGCLRKYRQRSGYQVTALGSRVIKQIEKINFFSGGNKNG